MVLFVDMNAYPDIAIATEESYGDAALFIFCDHASNETPTALRCLGLPGDLLSTHIALDIGASELSSEIAKRLGAKNLLKCGFSRLVVDANRAPDSPDLIPDCADQIPIPGNNKLSATERQARIDHFHAPYHKRLGDSIERHAEERQDLFVVSIHSFTNRLMGAKEERPWPIGILWREDETSAQGLMDRLHVETGWPIGDNQPYDARIFNYSVDRHIGPRGLRHLTIEVRQDTIDTKEGRARMANILADGIGHVMKKR